MAVHHGGRGPGHLSRITNAGFNPAVLFAASEQGAWFDPGDITTLFQDTAGNTPVTAAGQSVARINDKSGRGNHATQSNAANAPVYGIEPFGGRRNLLTYTQEFDNAAWAKTNATALPFNPATATLGPQLVANGDFASATGWTVNAGWAIGSGVATATATSSSLFGGFTSVSGQWYKVTFDCTVSSGTLLVYIGAGVQASFTTGGTKTVFLQSGASTSRGIEFFGGAVTGTVDNIVVQAVTTNNVIAPDGTFTADTMVPPAGAGISPQLIQTGTTVTSSVYTASLFVRPGTHTFVQFYIGNQSADWCNFTLTGSGSVQNNGAAVGAISYNSATGWYRISMVYTAGGTDRRVGLAIVPSGTATRVQTGTYVGTETVFLWGAQLEIGSTATAYQRVTDQWNVTEAGRASVGYIQFDGTDDWLQTGTITPGVDKAQVFVGVRKLSDAAIGFIAELSASASANTGAWALRGPGGAGAATYAWNTRGSGTLVTPGTPATYAAPTTNILTALSDISNDTAVLRVNGTQAASDAADQGTGNYLAYPLFIGRRGGSSLPYNGRLYSLIARFGANLTADQIAATEAWVNGRTGAY